LNPVLDGVTPDQALLSLYTEHHNWLQGWIRRKLGCSHRAADFAQATFCRLLEHGDIQLPQSPRSFLATIARRLLIDDIRRREIERAYVECWSSGNDAVDTLSPERIAEATQLLHGLLHLLWEFPPRVRKAFVLRRIEGLSHDETAAALGVSVRSVKRYMAQAYERCYAAAYPDR
jgi:RNA polymerase sigma-19 factor, ECF subfamily